MEEKENKNANKSNNKKIIICILVIIIVLIIIYFLVSKDTKNNVNNIVSPDMEIEEYGVQNVLVNISNAPAIAYDTYNQEEILYKDVALGGEIAYSIDYGAPESTSNALEFRKYLYWYIKGIKNSAKIRNSINNIFEQEQVYEVFDRIDDILKEGE